MRYMDGDKYKQENRGRYMARAKRNQVQAGDGWTVVAGSGGAKADEAEQLRDARPTRTVNGLTVEKLAGEFKKMEKQWRGSACAKNLEKTLSLRDWTVKEAVCIGIGSFSLDWDHRYRSLWQLVLFMAVVRTLQDNNSSIILYAQEPAFTALDVTFLATLSITVLPVSIETYITASSFVFAPFVDWYILLPLFLKNKDPQLYIGNEILDNYRAFANIQEKKEVLAECNQLGKGFADGRERRRIPEFELHGNALNGLMVYWREEDDD
ncbi:hypothetical protein P280DRAFT_475225 [Massarina eburnea CBS 473.64]|uniref:SRR1-like domain-containing protein n=1 Tax=Massarina eburnea CBS 473.64 TaxID=1395130 RepID=A0A6A6SIT9_9PLEO|nr:hypothetical protein P280DRAFT_475225 [Massarina eburnea CBS 473.64]